jgi:hypothetical protein
MIMNGETKARQVDTIEVLRLRLDGLSWPAEDAMVLPQMGHHSVVRIAARLPQPFRLFKRHPKLVSDQYPIFPRGGCVEADCALIL